MASFAILARRIREGSLAPPNLVEACLDVIAQRDRRIEAWAYVAAEQARAAARELAAELKTAGPRSRLHGIPFGVKDIFDTAGMPTEWGSPLYRGRKPEADARLVEELKRLGAIVLGKTHTTAFAYFDPGPSRNPHNPEHTPGGSSSGSAAAVAAGMVPFALGSQTLGSVLRPACFCGVVGFKPTQMKLSLVGVLPFAPSLDHAGLFARSAGETALLWEELTGERPLNETPPMEAWRWPPGARLTSAMAQGFAACVARLRRVGMQIAEASAPASFAALPAAIGTILAAEAAGVHGRRLELHGDRIGAKLAELVRRGLSVSAAEFQQASAAILRAREDYQRRCRNSPVTLTPAALGPAPRGLESTGDPAANAPWTALGVPALSIPFGRAPNGLPLGLQLTAPWGREALLLGVARRCEKALGAVVGSN